MKRIIMMLTVAAFLVAAMAATAPLAFAASPAEENCTGTFTPNPPGPEKSSCVTTEPTNPPGKGLTTTTTTDNNSEGGGSGTVKKNETDTSVKNKAGHEPAGQN